MSPWMRKTVGKNRYWHWCNTCQDYPDGANIEISEEKPQEGNFCPECTKRDHQGKCDGFDPLLEIRPGKHRQRHPQSSIDT